MDFITDNLFKVLLNFYYRGNKNDNKKSKSIDSEVIISRLIKILIFKLSTT